VQPGTASELRVGWATTATNLPAQNEANDARDELAWRWLGGEATSPADLGDPRTTDRYALCIYAGAVEPALVGSAIADAGGSCDSRPCWRAKTDGGFVYRTQTPNAAGITRVDLVPGESGGARVVVKGHGANLSLPDLPVVAPVLVQLSTSSGACWKRRTARATCGGTTANGFAPRGAERADGLQRWCAAAAALRWVRRRRVGPDIRIDDGERQPDREVDPAPGALRRRHCRRGRRSTDAFRHVPPRPCALGVRGTSPHRRCPPSAKC
jgi:hypothetical protein